MSSLSPLDLLTLSSDEQNILRCITKNPQMTVMDVSQETQLSIADTEAVLHALLDQARIVEQLKQGERVFSTRFKFQHKRVRNMPDKILNAFAQTPEQFLAETELTSGLSKEAGAELFDLGQERLLLPNEVVAWQGENLKFVALIQQGLLSSTCLKGNQAGQNVDYLHRGSWFGLVDGLNGSTLTTTYTAVTDTTLLVWPVEKLIAFAHHHPLFAVAVARLLSQEVRKYENLKTHGQSKLWVIDGAHPGAGATTFAANLALLTQQLADQDRPRTLFWSVTDQLPQWLRQAQVNGRSKSMGLAEIVTSEHGLDVLTKISPNSYSPQVQLNVLLNDLHAQYDTIICDTGSDIENELLLRLRGQADTLLTLTQDSNGAEAGMQRWQSLQSYSYPGQKRVLTLNKCAEPFSEPDPKFHLLIPCDEVGMETSIVRKCSLIKASPNSAFSEALREVYRRLSLNHSVALFVPSTMDVDQTVDNKMQVQETLSFLGNLFGGATSSNAEGAWRSEESGLVTEQVTIVKTFVSKKALDVYLDQVFNFASELKVNMKQEAVAVSVDNRLILV